LHGGLETVDMLPHLTDALARHWRVIAPERRAHGRTPDADGPITYEVMAADTLAVADECGVGSAHIVGYSDGANIAMLLGIAHPERVLRLVLIGGNFHYTGLTPTFREELRSARAETYEPRLRDAYSRLSPDGAEHWPAVFEKVRRMWLDEPTLTPDDLAQIRVPTLVLSGDNDAVSAEHTAALANAIPGARLEILTGNTSGLLSEQPALTVIADFLAR
jgi:pimeloyl-ACP methyl ester carboxylesterase